jgi:hypothetical protein
MSKAEDRDSPHRAAVPASMMRATYHLSILVLLAVMTVGGVGARLGGDGRGSARPMPELAGLATRLVPSSARASAEAAPPVEQTASHAAAGATPAPTRPAPARWVQNFRPTELFAGPERGAASLGTVGQFNTYRLVEDADGPPTDRNTGRAKLYDPGQGIGRLPSYVWADPRDFGPSGAPRPEFELGSASVVDPFTGLRTPERTGDSWPRLPSAELAVVLDGTSGGILYGKNAHARLAPASLTKIVTAIVGIEQGKPQDRVRVDVDSRTMWESTVMGLTPGDVVSLETLLYGLMLPSGNDAALAIARHVAGSDARFVELMNEKVRALGLEDSQFRNPHGLDEEGHYSSPYDLAMLARHGMQDPLFYNLSATRNRHADGFDLWNLNRLLGQYPGADGVKVGYTDEAGRCIVSSATRNGHRVFVTLIRSHDPVGESRLLLDYAFQNFKW